MLPPYSVIRKWFVSLIVIVVFLFSPVFAQQNVDSLKTVLQSQPTDSLKIDALNKLAWEIKSKNFDTAFYYALEAEKLCKKNSFLRLTADNTKIIATFYLLKGEFDKAIKGLNKAKKQYEAVNYTNGITKCNNNLGIIYLHQGKFDLAINEFKEAIKIQKANFNFKDLASTYGNLGIVYHQRGDYIMAMNYYLKALEINEYLGNKNLMADNYNNIASINEKLGDYPEALIYYQKAYKTFIDIENIRKSARPLYNISLVYRLMGELDTAIVYVEKSIEVKEQFGDLRGLTKSLNLLGEIYIVKEQLDTALTILKKSEKIAKENEYFIYLAEIYENLGRLYLQQNNYSKAIYYYKQTLNKADNIESIEIKRNATKGLSKAYAGLRKYKLAHEMEVMSNQLDDSLKREQVVEETTKLTMEYEFEKKQARIRYKTKQRELEHKAEMQKQLFQKRLLITAVIFTFLIVILFIYLYITKRKSNRILARQKASIEAQALQLREANHEITLQKEDIAFKNQEITDSITYAKRIQNAVLPPQHLLKKVLSEHFIFYLPRDIVSGDFYWFIQQNGKKILAAADCTGHGVPGAFMSMLGISLMNDVIHQMPDASAADILNQLRARIKESLRQTGKDDEAKDGIDMALLIIDEKSKSLQYAGAHNPLYYFHNNELNELKADKMPLGIFTLEKESFTNHEINFSKGDSFYIFSDGFIDQFGGEKGRKYKAKNFKKLLNEIHQKDMNEQKQILQDEFTKWKGQVHPQLDDILVIGFRL